MFNDQKALKDLQHKNLVEIANKRVVRLIDRVMGYDFHVNYIEGKLNYVADAMSRVEDEESEFPDIPNTVPMMGTVKRVKVGGVEWRNSRDLEEMAVQAKDDMNYQMIMNEVLKDTEKKDIKTTTDEKGNVKLHILQ